MRILAGKYKNKKIITGLKQNQKHEFRPTTSKTREAIFNIINFAPFIKEDLLNGAKVLDLFCGCGSFSMESLSRGAKEATLIDKSPIHLEIAKKNALNLGETANMQFFVCDATKLPASTKQYNIIYLDPPYYQDDTLKAALHSLSKGDWIAKDHIVIIECSKNQRITLPDNFSIIDERKYGLTKIIFAIHHLSNT